jgi:hypothetical protein
MSDKFWVKCEDCSHFNFYGHESCGAAKSWDGRKRQEGAFVHPCHNYQDRHLPETVEEWDKKDARLRKKFEKMFCRLSPEVQSALRRRTWPEIREMAISAGLL